MIVLVLSGKSIDANDSNLDEMLSRYERGWRYRELKI